MKLFNISQWSQNRFYDTYKFLQCEIIQGLALFKCLLELKNRDDFRRQGRCDLSNLPPATTGNTAAVIVNLLTGARRWFHRWSPAPVYGATAAPVNVTLVVAGPSYKSTRESGLTNIYNASNKPKIRKDWRHRSPGQCNLGCSRPLL